MSAQNRTKKARPPRTFTPQQIDRFGHIKTELDQHNLVLQSLGEVIWRAGRLFTEVEAQGLYELDGYKTYKIWLRDKYEISLDQAGKYKRVAARLSLSDMQGRNQCLNGWVILSRAAELKDFLLSIVDRHHPTAELLGRVLAMGLAKLEQGGTMQQARLVMEAIVRLGKTTLPAASAGKKGATRGKDLAGWTRAIYQQLQKADKMAGPAAQRQEAGDEVEQGEMEALLQLGIQCLVKVAGVAAGTLGDEAVKDVLRQALEAVMGQGRAEAGEQAGAQDDAAKKAAAEEEPAGDTATSAAGAGAEEAGGPDSVDGAWAEGDQAADAPEGDQGADAPEGDQAVDAPESDRAADAPESDRAATAPEGDQAAATPEGDQAAAAQEAEDGGLGEGEGDDAGVDVNYLRRLQQDFGHIKDWGELLDKMTEDEPAPRSGPEKGTPPQREPQNRRKTARAAAQPPRKTARQAARDEEYERDMARLDALMEPPSYPMPQDLTPPEEYLAYQRALAEDQARREAADREEAYQRERRAKRAALLQSGVMSEATVDYYLELTKND